MGLSIEVRLLNELKNAVEVVIRDDYDVSPAENNYIIRRYQKNDPSNDFVYSLHQLDFEMSTNNGKNEYKFLETVDNRGVSHVYVVTRINTITFDDITSEPVEVTIAPEPVKGVVINEYNSTYDQDLGLPIQVLLEWEPYNTSSNNYDVQGFSIYYSIADHHCSNWSKPEKLRGLSTDDTTSPITTISPDTTMFYVNVPQVTQGPTPKDMKLYIVAVTDNKQSELSDEVYIETKEFVGGLFNPGETLTLAYSTKENTDEQLDMFDIIKNPHYQVHLTENAYSHVHFVWCERLEMANELDGFDPMGHKQRLLGWDYCYKYRLNVSDVFSPVKVSIYYPLKRMLRMDVRVDYGLGFVSVPYTFNNHTSTISFTVTGLCEIAMLVKDETSQPGKFSTFSNATKRIIDRLPTWSKIRKKPTQSNGAYFLELMGLEFDDIENMMTYAQDQIYIPTSEMSQLGIIYKYKLPADFESSYSIAIVGDGHYLELATSLTEFMKTHFDNTDAPEIYYNNLFMVDYEEGLVYTRKLYEWTDVYIYKPGVEEAWFVEESVTLEPHKVWNFFDEFGLLLDVERHNWEDNEAYKARILDVFKNKSGASREGLLNGIARELSRRITRTWDDTSKDFVITDKMVAYNEIKINGLYVTVDNIWFTDEGYLLIKANKDIEPGSEVTYVAGVELRTLHNRYDKEFTNLLYHSNGTAKPLLVKYVKTIKDTVPIEWGKFHWNIGYWDTSMDEYGGMSYLPSLLDARIDGFYKE